MQLSSWRDLERQLAVEAADFEKFAAASIRAEQMEYYDMGTASAQAALRSVLGEGYSFGRFGVRGAVNMAGITADGSPLFDVLRRRAIAPDMVGGLVDALNESILLGYNPRKIAEVMADSLTAGLDKALVIARTEQLRAYRTATMTQYQQSGVVVSYQRHAAPSERTCFECIALDGKTYKTDVDFATHPQCRCFMTPILAGDNPDAALGRKWFENQSESAQRDILGGERYDLFKSGVPLESMVKVKDDPTWGNTLVPVPLAELAK